MPTGFQSAGASVAAVRPGSVRADGVVPIRDGAGRRVRRMSRLNLSRVREAVTVIDPVFRRTPQYESIPLGAALGCSIVLKVETMNPVGSFKGRGIERVLATLTDEAR